MRFWSTSQETQVVTSYSFIKCARIQCMCMCLCILSVSEVWFIIYVSWHTACIYIYIYRQCFINQDIDKKSMTNHLGHWMSMSNGAQRIRPDGYSCGHDFMHPLDGPIQWPQIYMGTWSWLYVVTNLRTIYMYLLILRTML